MEENDRQNGETQAAAEVEPTLLWVAVPLLAAMIITAALYFARDVMVPLCAALVLGIVLSPIARRLERYAGRFLAAALVVLGCVAILTTVAYFAVVELTGVADEVAGYSDNIGNKLAALQKSTPLWLRHIESAIADVQEHLRRSGAAKPPPAVRTVNASSGFLENNLRHVTPALAMVVEALLTVVLLFFLLYSRRDLRDRFVRLAARARITVAGPAIETAGHTVGRYLLLFSLINLGFGISIGLVLFALGLPNPEFWGLLAFLLRFVPYVGAITSSLLPALVAFAVFPGWTRVFEVLGAFVVLDQISAQFIEPFVIGSGIDMSPVALLVSTIYWSWLWGIPGLLLAIPLTACLKVAGEHIPALNFLALLLGGERDLEGYHDFYRMLLELDSDSARVLSLRYTNENSLEQTFDDVFTPAVNLAGDEHAAGHISDDHMQFIVGFLRDLIPDLGSRYCTVRSGARPRVLGLCPAGEMHSLGLAMMLELFRCAGATIKFGGEDKSAQQACDLARLFSPEWICLSCTLTEALPAAVELVVALKRSFPQVNIIAGGVAAVSYPADLLRSGCSQICGNRNQSRRLIRHVTTGRRMRTAPAPLTPPAAAG